MQYSNTILIPSARYVDQEMQFEVGRVPPVLIPVNGKPILELIIDRYSELRGNTRFVIAAHEGITQIEAYLRRRKKTPAVAVVDVGPTVDLAETIHVALELIDSRSAGDLYLNFGDTVIDAPIGLKSDVIYYDSVPESYRWATFHQEGEELAIVDRFNSDSVSYQSVFAGMFLLKDANLFAASLRRAEATTGLGKFYVALKGYLQGRSLELVKVGEWCDFGHVDNYYSSKKKFINKRFFNQIKIDDYRAIVEKRSQHSQKFYGEIKWYLEMPVGLRCYLPQVFDHALCGEDSYIRLEYYGYPSLSDMYLLGGHSLAIWNHVFEAIFRLLSEMEDYRIRLKPQELQSAMVSMYVTKTMERLRVASETPELEMYFHSPVVINGKSYPPVWEQIENLPELVNTCLASSLSELSIIHGDACLSNILFDPKSRIIKLIDPRGQFGSHTIYGDFRYDLAKLSHSFHGHYDLILTDSFELECSGNEIKWQIFKSEQQQRLAETFERRLSSVFPDRLNQIRLIESLLFLSMVPLHRDSPDRQIVMLGTGIEQYHRAVSNLEANR